jgi:DNA-binding NtrC family response regulator
MERIQTAKKTLTATSVPNQSKAKILVVDDDINVLETLRDILLIRGYDVEIALNGKQAVDFLKSAPGINLIITDVMMPEMDGLELLRQVRLLRKEIPVVILTAYPTVDGVIHAIEEGASDYLLKPFNMDELLETVKEALKKKAVEVWLF